VFILLVTFAVDGAIVQIFMDWRHMREMLEAGEGIFTELKNLCVWVKSNGGMGSFYRSRHELVFVWKSGRKPHINNFELGQFGDPAPTSGNTLASTLSAKGAAKNSRCIRPANRSIWWPMLSRTVPDAMISSSIRSVAAEAR
jgi:hypothetical protein